MSLPPFALVARRLRPDPIDRRTFDKLLTNTKAVRSSHADHWHQLYTAQEVAMVALMRDAFLSPEETADARWNDLHHQPDGSAILSFPRSQLVPTAMASVETMTLIRTACRIESTTRKFTGNICIFSRDPEQIHEMVRSVVATAGILGRYTAHSPRDGMILDLLQAGHGADEVAQAARLDDTARFPEEYRQ